MYFCSNNIGVVEL